MLYVKKSQAQHVLSKWQITSCCLPYIDPVDIILCVRTAGQTKYCWGNKFGSGMSGCMTGVINLQCESFFNHLA